ncbi:MAG: MiaB/RimO family radical SAM methylthiotransferase [Gammaproteobacteria bacterium]|nr:MiaB/RimO family radical SAM methylthiotransferase [Gammaproteobacteria bacterium]
MKFHIRTLGCKMNWLDSARLAAALQTAGHQAVNDEGEADYLFVNTCTVTSEADRKSKQTVNRAGRLQKQVAVLGCGPRVDSSGWRQQAANSLVFSDEAAMLAHFGIEGDELQQLPLNSRTRLPVAIQTGCDNACSFCITRVARGAHRSLPLEVIVSQVKQAVDHGVREVVLTGINLAAWGCDNSNRPEQARLHQLLEALLQQTAIARIRLSSLGPQYIQPPFFDLFADERLCDYLHISLQSGSDTVLERMVRGHGTAELLRLVERARAVRPATAIAADIIAGFPGEEEAEHQQTLALLKAVGFAKLHVFPYSERTGTPAATAGAVVEMASRKRRAAEIRELGRAMRQAFIRTQMGREFSVLLEGNGTGLSGNYIRMRAGQGEEGSEGEIITVTLGEQTLVGGE